MIHFSASNPPFDRPRNCADCGKVFPEIENSCGTGYGWTPTGEAVCYDCCAIHDQTQMAETGKVVLYLDLERDQVSNWPGTLVFKLGRVQRGKHFVAGVRYDVWFTDQAGYTWHGVTYGKYPQFCYCKRLKQKR